MSVQEKTKIMEEYGNNGIFVVDRIQMRVVEGKQEIYLEWPISGFASVSILVAGIRGS